MSEEIAQAAGDIAYWRRRAEQAESDAAALWQAASTLCHSARDETETVELPDTVFHALLALADVLDVKHPGTKLLAELEAARATNRQAAVEIARLREAMRQTARMKTIKGARNIIADAIGAEP